MKVITVKMFIFPGSQRAILKCIRHKDKREVYDVYCGVAPRYSLTRKCVNKACPPR